MPLDIHQLPAFPDYLSDLSGKDDRGRLDYVFISETPEQERAEDKDTDKDVDERIDGEKSLEPFTADKRRRKVLYAGKFRP